MEMYKVVLRKTFDMLKNLCRLIFIFIFIACHQLQKINEIFQLYSRLHALFGNSFPIFNFAYLYLQTFSHCMWQ